MIPVHRKNPRRRRGATVVMLAVLVPVLLAFTALTVDIGYLYNVKAELDAPGEDPREHRPEIGGEKGFRPPLPETFELDNGLTVHHWSRPELPLVQMTLTLGEAGNSALDSGLTSSKRSAIRFAIAGLAHVPVSERTWGRSVSPVPSGS